VDGVDVMDGALTNPFAHALATALLVDGSESEDLGSEVELELWHAYDIECDDTSSMRLVSGRGTTITVAVTLCAAEPRDPYLVIHGERGRAVLWYTRDELEIERADGVRMDSAVVGGGRTDLLENLMAHLHDPDVPLRVPLSATRGFMQALEAVRLAPDPQQIPERFQRITELEVAGVKAGPAAWQKAGVGTGVAPQRRTLPGVEDVVAACAERLALFSEVGAGWSDA
jgi:hypothetical protein